jgi:hypothetical protein
MTPAEDFGQLRLKFTDPVQHHYEVIRPIVLYSETISERSRQTGIERTQVGEKTKRFIQKGMFGLVDQRTKALREHFVIRGKVAARCSSEK